jgi:hypothetical protein
LRVRHLDILAVLAFLVYVVGVSLKKAGAVMRFFRSLPLQKSQIDALFAGGRGASLASSVSIPRPSRGHSMKGRGGGCVARSVTIPRASRGHSMKGRGGCWV